MTTPFLDGEAGPLLDAVLAWQRGELPRDTVVQTLSGVPADQGADIQGLIGALCQRVQSASASPSGSGQGEGVDSWRAELMGSRARAWAYPDIAGLLVGPEVILLVDSREGVVLRGDSAACLPASVCGSLVLLCQTIVMAQSAVDAQELQKLQQQRIESTSTSLSEIEPIK